LLRDVFGLGPPLLGTNAISNKASKTERVSFCLIRFYVYVPRYFELSINFTLATLCCVYYLI